MEPAKIDTLPEEILLQIITLLDCAPPSVVKARQEPTLNLTTSVNHDLKNTSKVSKRWRRVVLPILFTHISFRLDVAPRRHWARCPACGPRGLSPEPDQHQRASYASSDLNDYHAAMVAGAFNVYSTSHGGIWPTNLWFDGEKCRATSKGVSKELASRLWVCQFYHTLVDFLDFVAANNLGSDVESFTLVTDRLLPEGEKFDDRYPHRAAGTQDWRYCAVAAFWRHLFSVIDPCKITIVGPPVDLACLALCAIDTGGDWAFGDMDYHILTLARHTFRSEQLTAPPDYADLRFVPGGKTGVAADSVLNLRQWTQVSLNEGSFLKAYGTYEYFERGPPSLISSIKNSLRPTDMLHRNDGQVPQPYGLQSLRSFTYTAIFPFANHLDLRGFLPYLEELDIQIAPDPQSGILDDKKRTGKAQLEDCWSELMGVYHSVAAHLATFRILEGSSPRLKRFTCRDSRIAALERDLDDVFILLCLPVWVEMEPGFFTRYEDPVKIARDGGDWSQTRIL